jgi:hypothetical protein
MGTKDDLLKQLNTLITDGERLNSTYRGGDFGHVESTTPEAEFRAFTTAAKACIARIAGRASEFYIDLPKEMPESISVLGYGGSVIPVFTGSLVALRNAIDSNMLISLESRLRANVYDDFLEQANELLDAKYHVAAMTLIGGVLEDHLRKLCDARSLKWPGNGNISKYNDLLREKLYPQTTWRRIQSLADLRNTAAHGKDITMKIEDVQDAYHFASRFLADFPF